jgi:hypothetical protein
VCERLRVHHVCVQFNWSVSLEAVMSDAMLVLFFAAFLVLWSVPLALDIWGEEDDR